MVELRTLHFTDIHEEYDKLAVVSQFVSDKSIDAVLFTGDFLEMNPNNEGVGRTISDGYRGIIGNNELAEIQRTLNAYIQKLHQEGLSEDGKINPDKLPTEKKAELEKILTQQQNVVKSFSAHQQEITDLVNTTVNASYTKLNEAFSNFSVPVYAVMGNHDLKQGYDLLKSVTFVDDKEKAVLKGKNGTEFVIKGDFNTYELPSLLVQPGIQSAARDNFLNYDSGISLEKLDAQLEVAKRENKTEAMSQIEAVIARLGPFLESELERLGDEDEVDIYLSHKLPFHNQYGSGDIAKLYGPSANIIYAGHEHGLQVGNINQTKFSSWLAGEHQEFEEVDGQQVPILYIEDGEPFQFNPGTDHFCVTEYNANKEAEVVTVYEYVYE